MPRKANPTDTRLNSNLKELIRKKSGFPCTSFSDIFHLQLQIKKETEEILSVQTLNRFFGLIKSDFNTSRVTLNILSKYLNFNSFAEFVSLHQAVPDNAVQQNGEATEMLVSLFNDITPSGVEEVNLRDVVINLYKLIDKNESIEPGMYSSMAVPALGRKYFYENCIYIDKLNGQYGAGIDHYILHSCKREEFLFAYSTLCLRYFLSSRVTEFRVYFDKIRHFTIEEIKVFSPSVIAGYGAAVIYNEILNSSSHVLNKKAAEIINLVAHKKEDESQIGVACSALAIAMLLGGAYEEAWQILIKIKPAVISSLNSKDQERLLNQKHLLKVYAGFCAGRITHQKTLEEIKSIKKKPFHFFTYDFYSILLNRLIILTSNKKDSRKAEIYLQQLIKKTGFSFEGKSTSGKNPY
jgi:hypothetical protein